MGVFELHIFVIHKNKRYKHQCNRNILIPTQRVTKEYGWIKQGKDDSAEKLIFNKETLEAYYATLIRAEEAGDYVLDIDESFEVPRFVEDEKGELYALPYAFPPAGYADDSTDKFELVSNDDGSYTLVVHYNTLDDNDEADREHTYKVKYVNENGRWVFENFRLVKQH